MPAISRILGLSPAWVALGWTCSALVWPVPTRAGESSGLFKGDGVCQFLLEDYVMPAQTEAAINKVVADALRTHETVFGFKAGADFRVRVRIFGRFEEFERFTRTNRHVELLLQNSRSLTNLGGYYSHRIGQVITWRQRHPSHLANTLLHEASHAILHSAYRRVPIWLSEGSATYFAYPRHIQDDHDVGTIHYRWGKLNVLLRAKQLPPVRTILDWTDEDWAKVDPAVSYTTAWSMFQLMMSSSQRKQVLHRYLSELQRNRRRPTASAQLMDELYPGGVAQLEKDWHGWIATAGARVLGKDMEEVLRQIR